MNNTTTKELSHSEKQAKAQLESIIEMIDNLEKAEKIDKDHWLLKLEQLVRKLHLGEKIEQTDIDEKTFPDDLKIKANFYRLYASFFEELNDQTKADSFIEEAIHLNSDRFSNYLAKLSLLEHRLLLSEDISQVSQKSQELLDEAEKIENKFFEYGDIGPRNKALLNAKKLNALFNQENIPKFETISQETFKLSIS